MSVGAPWSVKGIDPKAREVAKDLARRSGMTLGEWLNHVILEDDVPDEITVESQFGERSFRPGRDLPRLRAVPSGPPDLARVASALDRLTDRIEASETRTGLAINGVEHSVRQALARIETAEREQQTSASRLEGLLAEASAQQSYFGERLRRLEAEPAGPRSAEALKVIEARVAQVEPEIVVQTVLERLGDRLAAAETRTAGALEQLNHALAALDRRMGAVEQGGGGDAEARFEALGQSLSRQVEAVRAEVADRIAQAGGGPAVEARFVELAEQVRAAERRAANAVEEIGRQVLAMAEAVGRKLGEVDQRSADAIDQVGSEVARIAGAVELRLARGEQVQAEAFDRFGAELARLTETISGARPAEPEAVAAPPPTAAPLVDETAAENEAAALAAALGALGPPPEPEPEPLVVAAEVSFEAAESEPVSAAFGPELLSRAESEPEPEPAGAFEVSAEAAPQPETIEAPWRRLDLDVPETTVPDAFAPLADGDEDEDLFREPAAAEPGPELSTREVIERARAAARAAQDRVEVASPQPEEVRAGLKTAGTGRLFEGFGVRPRRAPRHTALQTALMVAGGAAFMSVGAAGLVLMQEPAQQTAALAPEAAAPRAAMARSADVLPPASVETLPAFDTVRADVEAGVPGAVGQLKALAEAGHAQALLYLAQLYDEGDAGLPQNPTEARRLTTLAAENGDVKAAHNLGVYLFRGEGGPQDLSKAAHWFGRAAAAGVVESQYNLGLLYQSGSGVRQDLAEARHWFALAAAKGDEEARRALAAMSGAARPEPKPKPSAAIQPSAAVAAWPALAGTSMNVRQLQLTLARLGYYDGPLDGRASTEYHRAVAAWRRDQGGAFVPHIAKS